MAIAMTRAARQAALGIGTVRRPAPVTDHLEAAKALIKGTNLHIFSKYNAAGELVNLTLKRVYEGRWTLVGHTSNAKRLYEMAKKAVQS